ncbi:MAG: DUF6531 domain-containing protein, partial [Zoogloeaceae bacterium]|nr:DUF6531 domain-containing protein [Zoogloeaceae bacterium]
MVDPKPASVPSSPAASSGAPAGGNGASVSQRPPQPAIAPLNTIAVEDMAAGAAKVDKWLREISNNYITLERVKSVLGALPIIGNIIAAIDVLCTIIVLVKNEVKSVFEKVMDWLTLGINLIGVIPIPPTMAAARMSLRPTLALVRQRLKYVGMDTLNDTIVELVVGHLNESIVGSIEKFVADAQAKLASIMAECGVFANKLATQMAAGLEKLAKAELFNAEENRKAAEAALQRASKRSWYDPRQVIDLGEAAVEVYKAGNKEAANWAAAKVMPQAFIDRVLGIARKLREIGSTVQGKMAGLVDPGKAWTIAWLLVALLTAVKRWRDMKMKRGVPANSPGKGEEQKGQGKIDTTSTQEKAKEKPKPKKQCPVPSGTTHNISFALGDETITHSDFTLAGVFPLDGTRIYNSRLGALDNGSLGSRWLTPWSTRIEIGAQGLQYLGADGRIHDYPQVAIGQQHRDLIENLTIRPLSETLLTIEHGQEIREIYEKVDAIEGFPAHYRLRQIEYKGGVKLTLRYNHRLGQREILSDLLVTMGDTTLLHHLATRIDAGGRICEMWLAKDDQPVRQLARYFYQYHADGTADLIAAQDENGQTWAYEYQHHLVTRYTDRTGRGMNLAWDGTGSDARAYHEWADDGSYDTRLEWDPNIRLTYVTDAEGGESWHFYDIKGYTYRILHPDKREEWLFRDERKNVIRHLHPDGSADLYSWDERDNLTKHVRPDGGMAYFEYDDKDNLTGIQDPEGGIWKRDYDGKGNLIEEIDPLGNKTEYQYNKFNLPIEITDTKGGKKTIAYTATGQIETYTDCSSKTTGWEYDERGRLKRETNAAGETTQYRYADIATPNPEALDAEAEQKRVQWARQNAGQLEAVIHPDQAKETFQHDAEGRLLTHTDPLGKITEWRYTAAGLIGTRQDALGHLIQYRWDRIGRLTHLTNENSATARFQYDPVGKLLEETGFDQKTTKYRYDRHNGQLASVREGDAETRFEFDAAGRLSQRQSGLVTPDGKWNPESVEEYQWDRNGRLALAKNDTTQLQWFYDQAGNLTTEHQHYRSAGQTAVWHHQYDPLGNRIATLRPDGHRIERMTYGTGHVHGITLDGEEIVGFERDDLHRETERTFKNGLIHSQSYDPAGRLKEQILLKGKQAGNAATMGSTAPQLFKRAYAYDRAGQLTQIKDSGKGERNYRYDPVGRLTESLSPLGREKFAFDPASNLLDSQHTDISRDEHGLALETEKTPKVSKLLDNLLKDYAGTHYRYDERGNLVEKLKHGERTRYQWNANNQLVQVESLATRTRFAYDPLGRRIVKRSEPIVQQQWDAGSQYHRMERERISREQNLGTTFYGWDGDTLA